MGSQWLGAGKGQTRGQPGLAFDQNGKQELVVEMNVSLSQ